MNLSNEQKKVLRDMSLICIISSIMFFALEFILKNFVYHHQFSVFVSFMIAPVIILMLMKKSLRVGKIDKGFVYGILVYLFFFFWVFSYYFFNPGFFDVFNVKGEEFVLYNILIIMNVTPVDFFTKRIIQLDFSEGFGKMNGLYIQVIAWMMGHVYELFWLKNLMGIGGALLFIAVSGIVTGFVYLKTKNVLGFMFGHWLLNLFVILTVILL